MGMKKDLHLFLATSAMAMLGYEPPIVHRVPKKPSKGEAKKCKSCKFFPCYENEDPMRIACEKHERRKKK